ncbi:MAG: leucine-rich repeat protein, partial [Clostridia bacterium]|nr:leucine-rich repeat protein [Clostridia bacterium]
GSSANVFIPQQIDGKNVVSIGDSAFANNTTITNVVIPSGVKTIGNSAFDQCYSLAEITFEEGSMLKSIGYCALRHTALTSFDVPSGVTSLGSDLFIGSQLKEIVIPSSVTSFGGYMFSDCQATIYLESSTVPSATGWLDTWVDNSQIAAKFIPYLYSETTPTTQGRYWHYVNGVPTKWTESDFDYVVLADDNSAVIIKYVGNNTIVDIPEQIDGYTVTQIANGVFETSAITSIAIHASITKIGANAFANCTQLQSVVFDENSNLNIIGDYAFSGCTSLSEIVIPQNVTTINYAIFDNCLINIYCKIGQKPSGWNEYWMGWSDTATVYWYSANEPTTPGKYWHYVNGVPTKWNEEADYEYTVSNGEVTITKYLGSDPLVGIPAQIDGYDVVAIGAGAFKDSQTLTSIHIPYTVTTIADEAFYGCGYLQFVSFGENSKLTTIGNNAFYNCITLDRIIIPAGVTSIGMCAFYYCQEITIYCEASTEQSGWTSGWNWFASTYWYSANQPTTLGNYWYYDNGVPAIWDVVEYEYTIDGNNATITKYNGLDGVVEIPYQIDGYTVVAIGDYAFADCALTKVIIPANVTKIGDYAFRMCGNLKEVVFVTGSMLQEIGTYAFAYCNDDFMQVIIPAFVTSIDGQAFAGNEGLTIYCEATSQPNGWHDNWNFDDTQPLPTYWYSANQPTSAGDYWYHDHGIPVKWDQAISSAYEYTINNNQVTITGYNGTESNLVIPSYIESYPVVAIGASAFESNHTFTSVSFPDSITSIGNSAFYNTNLYSVSFGANSQLEIIESFAFGFSAYLTSVYLPASLKTLATQAFDACSQLQTVEFAPNSQLQTINDGTFNACWALSNVILPDNLVTIGNDAMIGGGVFGNCSSLKSISIPDSVTSIGVSVFNNCIGLTTVDFGENSQLSAIEQRTFSGCQSLEGIEIPASVTEIKTNAFTGCYMM